VRATTAFMTKPPPGVEVALAPTDAEAEKRLKG
jgi:hypothetical protein